MGTYAFTQLVNHLNQEKANLLEKTEHYERDIQVNVQKDGKRVSKSLRDNFDELNDVNSKFGNLENEFEFYYEKNVNM